jgi:hypothetical protein
LELPGGHRPPMLSLVRPSARANASGAWWSDASGRPGSRP